jgi:hypothetical protein
VQEMVNALRSNDPFLRKLRMILIERFDKDFLLRTEYRLFMSQRFKLGKTGSKELLIGMVEAGLAENRNRGIYLK